MKKYILMLMTLLLLVSFVSCKDDLIVTPSIDACIFDNPLEDLEWLNILYEDCVAMAEAGATGYIAIYQCSYVNYEQVPEEQIGFIEAHKTWSGLYTCDAKRMLCDWGGFRGYCNCEENDIVITSIEEVPIFEFNIRGD